MTKAEWKVIVEKSCRDAGTYREFFDSVIDTLASILETRDNAQELFEAVGGRSVINHTSVSGSKKVVKNPALGVVMDCNAQALAYWRDLGLTPSGYKKLNADALKGEETNGGFEALLDKLSWGESSEKSQSNMPTTASMEK